MNSEECAHNHSSHMALLSFKNLFAQLVEQHIASLSDNELSQLETCARRHSKISDIVCIDEVSVSDMLASPFYQPRASVIAYIDLKPVLYYNGAGIYQWSDTLDKQCLSYWLTYPELPPGWELN
ncbi:hypothetical protein [Chromobacterium vaccinii]|uniref:hypothetical protein n=1 Tax=Chromobacterium vaccinii TaxID=1108595 RepID=UPI0011C02BC0|nr:hypothetical protein [Chromobacterium vaccinii]